MKLEEARKGFKIHELVYGVVNGGLVTLNMLIVPQVPWFMCPLIGWGIGLANHYYFGVRKAGQFLEERCKGWQKENKLLTNFLELF